MRIDNWQEANQQYLVAQVDRIRGYLGRRADGDSEELVHESVSGMDMPSAIETLCATFELSPFERDLLLLCAGVELDSSFAAGCASAQGGSCGPHPTFSLALSVLPGAHWSALMPTAPLRRWRLIDLGMGELLTTRSLRIDERILHYLVGIQHLDERLMGVMELTMPDGILVPSHGELADRLASTWAKASASTVLPIVQLCGDDSAGKSAIAAHACSQLRLSMATMSAHALPTSPADLDSLVRLWQRETLLSPCGLLLDCHGVDAGDSLRENAIARLAESTYGVLVISSRQRRQFGRRPMLSFDVGKPTPDEQRAVWHGILGEHSSGLNGHVDLLVSQFDLNPRIIQAACAEATGLIDPSDPDQPNAAGELGGELWNSCRVQARPRLDDLAQRIEPIATWDDLVLPDAQLHILRQISVHVRRRTTVYDDWGFARKGARGLGISALFVGVSGTGKTLSAEVLAGDLNLDVYRIDLSQVVSKYIGETEKNLQRVFDAAEEGGAILLFDEADALFGKRSEVKDSHDRYANIEVSYLLQRMEAYRGLAILTTNLKSALDTAFLRRIRFVVQFPFPDVAQRSDIWRRVFPSDTPTDGLDPAKLSKLNITGGNIRNIALNAAFLAADAGEPVQMKHMLSASRMEYTKLEKPLTEAEIGGWV